MKKTSCEVFFVESSGRTEVLSDYRPPSLEVVCDIVQFLVHTWTHERERTVIR